MLAFLRNSRGLAATAVAGTLVLGGAFALLTPSTAFAADRGKVSLEPVKLDKGTTFLGTDPKGPFSTTFNNGLSSDDKNTATGALGARKPDTTYPWGSVGAKNGSIILNNTGKAVCKFVVSITDTSTFETAPGVGVTWKAEVSKDKKTITFTAVKQPGDCVANGDYFWMQVPKSPGPGSGEKPTLEGSFAALTPDPNGETAVAELTTDGAFVSTLSEIDQAIAAEGSPSPSDTAAPPTNPSDSPTDTSSGVPSDSPTATGTDAATDAPSAAPTDSSSAADTTSPVAPTAVDSGSPGASQ